jgi:glycosyltransferase involved in cell wall biosynthesis
MTKIETAAPTITVLMSCYNAASWLNEAINSILHQTFKDFEFIIIDDGSNDETMDIIQGFAKQDKRIVIITKPNTGLADSLNVGIQKARGEWIARLDADDICEDSRLEKQLILGKSNPKLVFIGSGLTEIDQNGNPLSVYKYPSHHASLIRNLRIKQKFPPHSSAFFRTKVVCAIGGYRKRIHRAQDLDLWLRLSEVGELASIKEPLVRIRKHPDQISHDDYGRRQIIDSRVAMTSYFFRRHGFADPGEADETSFIIFWNWIAEQLEADGLFAFENTRSKLIALLTYPDGSVNLTLRGIAFALKQPAFLMRFLKQKLVGEKLAHRLTTAWMNQSKNVKV